MKGTVAPPSSNSTAVLTWSGRIRISAASWAKIFDMEMDFFQASERVCHTAAHTGLGCDRLVSRSKTTKTSFTARSNDKTYILRR
jgi:hypothetical protein